MRSVSGCESRGEAHSSRVLVLVPAASISTTTCFMSNVTCRSCARCCPDGLKGTRRRATRTLILRRCRYSRSGPIVTCTDRVCTPDRSSGSASGAVRGSAGVLLNAMWRRRPASRPAGQALVDSTLTIAKRTTKQHHGRSGTTRPDTSSPCGEESARAQDWAAAACE